MFYKRKYVYSIAYQSVGREIFEWVSGKMMQRLMWLTWKQTDKQKLDTFRFKHDIYFKIYSNYKSNLYKNIIDIFNKSEIVCDFKILKMNYNKFRNTYWKVLMIFKFIQFELFEKLIIWEAKEWN